MASFKSFFSKQAMQPAGWFGRIIMSALFDKGNAPHNRLVLEHLNPAPSDHILEIGSGTGALLSALDRVVEDGTLTGIDFSNEMVAIARKRLAKGIGKGKITLIEGNFDAVDIPEESFHKVCSVNTIYFWEQPEKIFAKIFRVLKPGGALLLGFEDRSNLEKKPLDADIFRIYDAEELESLSKGVGFTTIEDKRENYLHCFIARK